MNVLRALSIALTLAARDAPIEAIDAATHDAAVDAGSSAPPAAPERLGP